MGGNSLTINVIHAIFILYRYDIKLIGRAVEAGAYGSRLCHICDCASLDHAIPLSSLSSPMRLCRETFRISGRTRYIEIQIELNVVWQDRSNVPTAPRRAASRRAVPRGRKLFCLIFHGLLRSTLS